MVPAKESPITTALWFVGWAWFVGRAAGTLPSLAVSANLATLILPASRSPTANKKTALPSFAASVDLATHLRPATNLHITTKPAALPTLATFPTAVPLTGPATTSHVTAAKLETFATAVVTAHAVNICAVRTVFTTQLKYLLAKRAIQQRTC